MVSENQSGNLCGTPLQSLEFPSMIATENIVKKKLKIKIASKRIEVEPRIQSCEFSQQLFANDKCDQTISVTETKSRMSKSLKFVLRSSNDTKLYSADDNLMVISSSPGSNKRRSLGVVNVQKEKRQKMDQCVTQQCSSILEKMMTHPAGWVFNQPVDPVKLDIPDYFSIISEPMDLGTIKTKLENSEYFSVEEFAADVRLTFSNAMLYNPSTNSVHRMAKQLDNIFNTRWKNLEAKWKRESTNAGQGHLLSGRAKNTNNSRQICRKASPLHISLLPKRLMSADEKKKLKKQLVEVSKGRIPQYLQGFLKKFGLICQKEENMEVDIDVFDDDTLWELKRVLGCYLDAKAAKVESSGHQSLGKIVSKGSDMSNKLPSGSANTKPQLNAVSPKCGSCGSMRCVSDHASSSDLSLERSLGHDLQDGCRMDCKAKDTSSQMSKSDPDSDGVASALDEGNACSNSQLPTLATTAASAKGCTPLIDVQLSPKKALRAAILKSRFADTILKAQQKTLLDQGDNADPVKMQQEKERLEKLQCEERARIEAEIKAAEAASRMRAEVELKMQRERERQAARLALQKMEKTVEINNNLEILKELEMLSGGSPSDSLLDSEDGSEVIFGAIEGGQFGKPLERLGLFIKDDVMGDEDEEVIQNGDGEEGEILS